VDGDADIAAVAALIGDRTRALMLLALLDGRPLPAGELAAAAGVSRPTASSHLAKLADGGLLSVDARGRHRYYGIATPQVAELVEAIQRVAPAAPVRSLRDSKLSEALRFARMCYDHLAGELAVDLVDALQRDRLLTLTDGGYEPSPLGADRLGAFGIDVGALRSRRRSFARACLDWSERRPHVAGALGAAIAGRMIELGWIRRAQSGRAVHLMRRGEQGLEEHFGLTPRRGR
jgi:DNA-binding transcriptional ArsR family regulator